MPYADRERQRAAARESARRRRAARRAMAGAVTGATNAAKGATQNHVEPLRQAQGLTPADLAQILAEEIDAVRESMPRGNPERARVLVQLAGAALRCYETGDIAARLEMLERAYEELGERRGALRAV